MIAAAAPNIKFSKDVSWLRIQITQQWAASDHLRKMTKSLALWGILGLNFGPSPEFAVRVSGVHK